MNAAWQAFGEVLRRNRWIGAALAIGSAVATFLLAGPTVGFIFVIVVLAVFLVLALQMLGSRPDRDGNGDSSDAVIGPIDVAVHTADADEREDPLSVDAAQGASADAALGDEDDRVGPGMLAVRAALDGDIPRLKEILEEWIAHADTGEERTERKSMGDYLLVHAGDGGALQALRKAVEDGARPKPRVLNMYANALTIASNPDQAVEALREKSTDFSTEDRAEAMLHAAQILHDNDRSDEAKKLLDEILSSQSISTTLLARAWSLLGDGHRPTEPIAAAISYERALELDPSLHGTRFDLAYLYSELNLYLPARLHYLALDAMNRASATAVNNLAVANEHFGLTTAGYERYEEAAAAGSALAHANIAHLYLSIGAVELAERAIEAGRAIDANDARVITARDRLANMRRDEAKRSKELAPI